MRFALFLAAAVFLLYFFGLGSFGLVGPDEPRYAQVAREMLESGDYVTPRLHGTPWFEKPPLYYWMAAVSFRVFGVTEWAARFPVALSAAGFLLLFAWMVRRLFDETGARLAVAVLSSTVGWIGFGRAASMEMLFSASVAGALGFLALWVADERRAWLYGFYGCLAFSMLAKGPTGVGLAALVLAVYSLVTREYSRLWKVLAPGPLALLVVVALPWYVAVYARNGWPFVEEFIVRHHLRRFVTEELAHPGPFWYYVPVLLGLIFPWTAHIALAIAAMWRAGWRGVLEDRRRLFLLVWVVVIVGFFSLSKGKLPGYVLMTVPALAAWIGYEMGRARLGWVRGAFLAQAALLPLFVLLAALLPESLSRGLTVALRGFSASLLDPALAIITVAGAIALAVVAWRGRPVAAALVAVAIMAVALARTVTLAAPYVDAMASARPIAQTIAERGIAADQIGLEPGVRRHIEYGLEFYLNRDLPRRTDTPWVLTPDGLTKGPL